MGEEVDLEVLYEELKRVSKKLDVFDERLNRFESKFDRMNNIVRPAVEKMLGDGE